MLESPFFKVKKYQLSKRTEKSLIYLVSRVIMFDNNKRNTKKSHI